MSGTSCKIVVDFLQLLLNCLRAGERVRTPAGRYPTGLKLHEKMEAPLPTIPSVAQRPRPTTEEDGVLMYVQEVVSGAATLLQQVPVVGGVCATFLSLQKLVETARSNEEDLANLCDLCDVVIKGVLDKHSDRSGLYQGFVALEVHVKKAEEVAKRCNGVGRKRSLKRFFLTRKTSDAIAAIRSNILSLTTANTLALTEETLVSTKSASLRHCPVSAGS